MVARSATESRGKSSHAAKTISKKVPKKDGGPKRPLIAYMHFAQERRKTLIQEKPQLKSKVTEASKIIGAEWKELSETEKEKYRQMAQDDRIRYEREVSAAKKKSNTEKS